MFTGIIESLGEVLSFSGERLIVTDPGAWPDEPWVIGESIAINGCCLTLVALEENLCFDISEETLQRTSFQSLAPGRSVNMERAMKAGERFGGHIVQGHVDGVGQVESLTELPNSWRFEFTVPHPRYLIDKGSVTVEGVSLTVVEPKGNRFSVAVIPHTFRHTTLGLLQPGQMVNLEYDLIAKYVERLLSPQ